MMLFEEIRTRNRRLQVDDSGCAIAPLSFGYRSAIITAIPAAIVPSPGRPARGLSRLHPYHKTCGRKSP